MHVAPKAASDWRYSLAVRTACRVSEDFPRERRIVKTDDFSSVFRLRPRKRTGHFVLYARPGAATHARLGIVVAKRLAPRAVTRNTVKRICRELFRKTALPPMDCIVRLAAPLGARGSPATGAGLKRRIREELQVLLSVTAAPTEKVKNL